MKIKKFLKPNALKVFLFLFIGIVYLYLAGENACGAGFGFSFCYKASGFPFLYVASGNVGMAFGYLKTLFFGSLFIKFGTILFNPAAFLADIILIYLFACLPSLLFNNKK